MLKFPIFPGRPTYCPAAETLQWSVSGRIHIRVKKEPVFRLVLPVCVGITYLPGQSPAKYCRRT